MHAWLRARSLDDVHDDDDVLDIKVFPSASLMTDGWI